MSNMKLFARRLLSSRIAILGVGVAAVVCVDPSSLAIASSTFSFPREYPQANKHILPETLSFIDGARLPSQSLGTSAGARHDREIPGAIADLGNPPLPTQIAQGTRYVEVREVKGTVTYGKSMQAVKVGQRLQASEQEFSTGNNSTAFLEIDSLIGTVELAENTTIRVTTLSSGKTSFYVIRGRVRSSIGIPYPISAGQKSLPIEGQKSLLAQSNSSSGNYPVDIETPAGIAGVQGTSFGIDVGPDGKTAIQTVDGTVAAIAQGQTVLVNRGQYVIIQPGKAPTQAMMAPQRAEFRVLSVKRVGDGAVRVIGQAGPLDLVYVNGRAVRTDIDGKFSTLVPRPVNRRIKFVVRGPVTTETFYEIAVL